MQKIVHIVGPTGVGKTDLAVNLAKKFNGQLISADSVQVYKTLDIISGKDIPKGSHFNNLKGFKSKFQIGYYKFFNIPIFLLDVVFPETPFSVHDFKMLSDKFISYIATKNKLPIIVGGTGFYIKALHDNFDNLYIPPDLYFRSQLEKLDLESLKNQLGIIDSQKLRMMNNSDINNPRRLIRAIEISKNLNRKSRVKEKKESYHALTIGLKSKSNVLNERIDKRVEKRLKDGALEEARKLYKNYPKLSQQVKNANGYKQLFSYLKKEILLDEAIYRWKISEYHHAKNQMTWFKKYGDTIWFDINEKDYIKKIEKLILQFQER